MVQIDSTAFQQLLDLAIVAPATIDGVPAAVITGRRSRDDELRVRDCLKLVWARLYLGEHQSAYPTVFSAHQVNDFPEVHFDATFREIGIIRRVVDQLGELSLTHL